MTISIKPIWSADPNEVISEEMKATPPASYAVLLDGKQIANMFTQNRVSVFFGDGTHRSKEPDSILSGMSLGLTSTGMLVGLLSAHESTIPDKRHVGVVLHAQAHHFIQDMLTPQHSPNLGLRNFVKALETKQKYTSLEPYKAALTVLEAARQQMENGDQDDGKLSTELKAVADSFKPHCARYAGRAAKYVLV